MARFYSSLSLFLLFVFSEAEAQALYDANAGNLLADARSTRPYNLQEESPVNLPDENTVFRKSNSLTADCPSGDLSFNEQTAVDAFIINHPQCTHFTGSIKIEGSDIANLGGLHNLVGIDGNLDILNASSLVNLDDLSSLSDIGKNLYIRSNSGLTHINGLSSVTGIGGALLISGNPALTNVNGLSSVIRIDGYLELSGNPVLKNVDGLSSLTRVGGGLAFFDNSGLTNLGGLSSVTSIGGRIEISDNAQLTDILGIRNIPSDAIKNLAIYRNPSLFVCNLPNICAYLSGSGARIISDNAGDCISTATVSEACITCKAPKGIATGTLTAFTAAFTWDAAGNASAYHWVVVANGADPATATPVASGTVSAAAVAVTGLSETTVYDFYIKADCGTAGESAWSAVQNFTTPSVCPPGSMVFRYQADIDNFITQYPHCMEIAGVVNIGNDGIKDITNLNGLRNITRIRGHLAISSNDQLTNVNGLSSLKNIEGGLNIFFNKLLTNLDGLSSLTRISGDLIIQENEQLTDVSGLRNIDPATISGGWGLHIIFNRNLSVCNLPNFCTYLAGGGSRGFWGNRDECVSAEAVISACNPLIPTLATGTVTSPATCGGTGSIAFTTEGLPDGDYTLNFKKDGGEQQAIVKVEDGEIIFPGPAGVYTDFSIVYNDSPVSNSSSVTLSDPAPDRVSFHEIIQPTACGGSSGRIFLYTTPITIISGRQLTLNFKKDGIEDSQKVDSREVDIPALINLTAGTYSDFSYTDSKGCLVTYPGPVTLTVPAAPALTAGKVTHPATCWDPAGSIAFTTGLDDGTYNLAYQKDGQPATPKEVTVTNGGFTLGELPHGEYSDFSMSDLSGCTATAPGPVILSDPTSTLSITRMVNPTTCGGTDGRIEFLIDQSLVHLPASFFVAYTKDGITQYPQVVTDLADRFTLPGLSAGEYSNFSYQTSNGCAPVAAGPVILEDPVAPLLTAGAVTNPTTCGGKGSIAFSTGLPERSYELKFMKGSEARSATVNVDAQGTFTLEDLAAGEYSGFSITHNGCVSNDNSTKTLNDPTPVQISVHRVYDPTACGKEDGQINFDGYNENTDYPSFTFYFKRNGKEESRTSRAHCGFLILGDLGAGELTDFRFTDYDNCLVFLPGPVTLTAPAPPELTAGEVTNPATCGGTGSIAFSTGLPEGSYELKFLKGSEARSATVTVDAQGTFPLEGLTPGEYSGFSITHNGCLSSDNSTKTLSDPTPEVLSIHFTTDPSGCGASDGRIQFVWTNSLVRGKTMNFKKNGVAVSASMSVLADNPVLIDLTAGTYSDFSYTDENGCLVTYTGSPVVFTEKGASVLTAGAVIPPATCGGTGSIAFSTGLPEGSFELKFMKGSEARSATVIVDAQGTFPLEGLTAGEYSGFSITHNGCISSDNSRKTVSDPAAEPLVYLSFLPPTVCGGSDGEIYIAPKEVLRNQPYLLTFKKNGEEESREMFPEVGKKPAIGHLTAGTYSDFSYTSPEGCTSTYAGPVILTDPLPVTGVITPDGPTELCEDDQVSLTAPAGASYVWSSGQTTRTIRVSKGGNYTVTVTSAQGCESVFSITVTQKMCNLPPVAVCKPLVVLVVNADCYAVLTPQDPDGGSYDPNGDWTRHSLVGTDGIFRPGDYTVTYAVTDPKGAYSTCQTRVQVVDHTPPVARARDLTLELDARGKASVSIADVDAGSYDNCGPVTLSLNRSTFDCSDLGHLQVRLTVTDASGNVSEALSDITITDNTPPVIQAKDLTLALDENGRASVSKESLITGISDNCGIWSVSLSQNEFSCADIGQKAVTITAEDIRGNRTTATVTVTVVDNTPPVVRARNMTLYLGQDGKASLTSSEVDDSSRDNCGITRLSIDREQFDCNDLGEQPLTLTAADAAGNTSEAAFTVTVLDTLPPVVQARDITLYLDAAGSAVLSPEDIDEGSTDNCSIAGKSLQYTAFDCRHTGTQPVQYTVTDGSGNRTTVVIRVTVTDTLAPEAIAQNAVVELDWNGRATLSAADADGGSTDNCGIAEQSLSQTDFSCTDLGRRLVTLTVRDVNGNTSTARAVVEVKDPNGVCPCSYGVLAFEGITLKHNEVSAGGVGVIRNKKKVKLRHTLINRESTFVKAPQTSFDKESESSTYIRGSAPEPEAFRKNGHKDKKKERAGKGESLALEAGHYGKVKAGKDATLTFRGGEVYIRSLKTRKNVSLVFTEPTVVLVRNRVKLGTNAGVNTGGEQIRIYAGGHIMAGKASEIRGILHTGGRLKTRGSGEVTSMEGLFVANKIRGGKNTHWAGGGVLCTGNEEPEPLLAAEKKQKQGLEKLTLTDSTDTGLQVTLWPNPVVTDLLKIAIESKTAGGELLLIDLQGNVLVRKTFTGHREIQEIKLDRAQPGTYVLQVSSEGRMVTRRVLKGE